MDYNLNRFIKAQNAAFDIVYDELKNGKKESPWMEYIFPQIYGLGNNDTAIYYAISNINEAKAYLNNEVLKQRMDILLNVLLELPTNDPVEVFGFPDNLKFWASMTLFYYADSSNTSFLKIIDKYFKGNFDIATINILNNQ